MNSLMHSHITQFLWDSLVYWHKSDSEKVALEAILFDKALLLRIPLAQYHDSNCKFFFIRKGFNVFHLPDKEASARSPCTFIHAMSVIGEIRNTEQKKDIRECVIISCHSERDKIVLLHLLKSLVSRLNKDTPTEKVQASARKVNRRRSSPRLRSRSGLKGSLASKHPSPGPTPTKPKLGDKTSPRSNSKSIVSPPRDRQSNKIVKAKPSPVLPPAVAKPNKRVTKTNSAE